MDVFTNGVGQIGNQPAGDHDVIQEALVAVRNHLGMDVAYFSEFVDGRTVFRRVDAPGLEHLIKVGDSHSLDDVDCNHILEGRLPELIPDTSHEPMAVAMPITQAAPIGSHVSIPVRLADGTPFGMFCCLSPRPMPTLNQRDLETMRVFAGLAAKQVNQELGQRRAAVDRLARIRSVLAERAFGVVYQPIFRLCDLKLSSFEALCRFTPQPYRSPDKWFQDAADAGLGVDLELAVIAAAVNGFDRLPGGVGLAFNASPETIVSGRLTEALSLPDLDRTTLEITEHAQVSEYAALHAALAPFKQRGMKVAVDDAGAGYSGLQHIVQLAPDVIKLDMSLTRGVHADPARRALARAMIYYARETGSTVVAEGVETDEELRTLQALGVDKGQGYLLGKPGQIETYVASAPADLRLAS